DAGRRWGEAKHELGGPCRWRLEEELVLDGGTGRHELRLGDRVGEVAEQAEMDPRSGRTGGGSAFGGRIGEKERGLDLRGLRRPAGDIVALRIGGVRVVYRERYDEQRRIVRDAPLRSFQ